MRGLEASTEPSIAMRRVLHQVQCQRAVCPIIQAHAEYFTMYLFTAEWTETMEAKELISNPPPPALSFSFVITILSQGQTQHRCMSGKHIKPLHHRTGDSSKQWNGWVEGACVCVCVRGVGGGIEKGVEEVMGHKGVDCCLYYFVVGIRHRWCSPIKKVMIGSDGVKTTCQSENGRTYIINIIALLTHRSMHVHTEICTHTPTPTHTLMHTLTVTHTLWPSTLTHPSTHTHTHACRCHHHH